MDQKVEIKEEPVWLEETTNTTLENFELVSEMIPVKQETKSDLTAPVPTQENALEVNFELESSVTHLKEETKPELLEPGPEQPAADIKDEIIIGEHTIDQIVPLLKEENSVEDVAVLTKRSEGRTHCCTACSMVFSQELHLDTHLLTHFKGVAYICDVCKMVFRYKRILKQHLTIHSGERLFCEECNTKFTHRSDLQRHMVIHTGQQPFDREQGVGTVFLRGNLRTRTEDGRYFCITCNKSFSQLSNLRSHILVHSGYRPYSCKKCSSSFKQRAHLQSHMVLHTGERQYRCAECNAAFKLRTHLLRHLLIHN